MTRTVQYLFFALSVVTLKAENANRIEPSLYSHLSTMGLDDEVQIVVVLTNQVDLASMNLTFEQNGLSKSQRVAQLVPLLRDKASQTQGQIISYLEGMREAKNIKSFWVVNMLSLTATKQAVLDISNRSDVQMIYRDVPIFPLREHVSHSVGSSSLVEENLKQIKADNLWGLGFRGQNVLLANFDTGVNQQHEALVQQWWGNVVQTSQAWRDFTPNPSPTPVDWASDFHGTHTMGTMVGYVSGSGKTVGVAPEAKWMAAAVWRDGQSSPALASFLNSAFQWTLDPDDNPNTTTGIPDVINISMGFAQNNIVCSASSPLYYVVVANRAVESVGTAVCWSAGNYGELNPSLSGICNHKEIFCVGNLNTKTQSIILQPPFDLNISSSRGPSQCPDAFVKPELVAPGTAILSASSGSNGYAYLSGTSMAAPHISGAIALLLSALRSQMPNITGVQAREILKNTAVRHASMLQLSQPNPDNKFGFGLIDCNAAYQSVVQLRQKFENGAIVSTSAIGLWNTQTSMFDEVAPNYNLYLGIGKYATRDYLSNQFNTSLKADYRVFNQQKFHNWQSNDGEITTISIKTRSIPHSLGLDLTSLFRETYANVRIITTLEDVPVSWGTIEFKDPWLVDFNDAPYGLRNRGMAAPFYDRASPFTPDLTTAYPVQSGSATYKGVFLNQVVSSGTYYSVRAQSSQSIGGYTGDFLGWAGVGATPSTPAALETPVVFTAPNAVVSARYKGRLLSSLANATSAGNQRRLGEVTVAYSKVLC